MPPCENATVALTRQDSSSNSSSEPVPVADGFGDLRLSSALRLLSQAGQVQLDDAKLPDFRMIQRIIDGLCELSSIDALTGLANVRQFRIALDQELDRVSRGGTPMALMMIDADRFKSVNDMHGHVAGDIVLEVIARGLQQNMRPMDTLARYGGEEFAAILPNCLPQHAMRAAERFRAHIEAQQIKLPDGQVVRVTVSVGVVCVSAWNKTDGKSLIHSADRQLYAAKSAGRNRVVMDSTIATGVSVMERTALLSAKMQANNE